MSGCLLVVGLLIDLFSSYRAAHFGVVSGFRLFAWHFSRAGGCYAVRLRGCLVKGAWVVFGLIRVVGSLLEQARPRVHSFSIVRQGLYCLDRIVGFPVLPTWSTALFWSKAVPFSSGVATAMSDEPCSIHFDPYGRWAFVDCWARCGWLGLLDLEAKVGMGSYDPFIALVERSRSS